MKARIKRKWKVGKYIKHHTYTNVLNREFKVSKPGKKYVSDVMQLKMIGNKKHYLYPSVDLYNNEIKSFTLHDSNNHYLVKETLKKINLTGVEIMHSDQGSQFTSYIYSEELGKYNNLKIYMSHVGECYDNAQIESIFGHIKDDFYTFYNPQKEEELYSNMS